MSHRTILICFDGSDAAKEAIERTALLHPGAAVDILTVWQPMQAFSLSWGMMAGDLGHIDAEAKQGAAHIAASGAAMARAAGLVPTPHVEEASTTVARTILHWEETHPVKLIVVGATGRSALSDVASGSVANALVHHATTPVLLVRLPRARHRASGDTQSARQELAAR